LAAINNFLDFILQIDENVISVKSDLLKIKNINGVSNIEKHSP